jgi:hypothetical protein
MYVCMYVYMQVYVFICEPVSEEETVSGTVHGLHREFLILDFEDKHILPQERKKEHVSVYVCMYVCIYNISIFDFLCSLDMINVMN